MPRRHRSIDIAALVVPPAALRSATASSQPPTTTTPVVVDVAPGELFIEPATLITLGFEWRIQGDENGRAPDLGALESGEPQPVYGPRP
jgi:hypothetical protein